MAIIVILCGAPHLYKKDMNNSGLLILSIIASNKYYVNNNGDKKSSGEHTKFHLNSL